MKDMIFRNNIRLATPEDEEEISKLNVAVWQQAYKHIFSDEYLANLNWQTRSVGRRKFFEDPAKTIFVYELNQKIIGFCGAGPAEHVESVGELDSSFGEIYAIYVLEAYQNQGIGKALYQQAVSYLKSCGFKSLLVWALVDNKAAIEFYLRCGCDITTWHKNFEADDQEYSEIALIHDLA